MSPTPPSSGGPTRYDYGASFSKRLDPFFYHPSPHTTDSHTPDPHLSGPEISIEIRAPTHWDSLIDVPLRVEDVDVLPPLSL